MTAPAIDGMRGCLTTRKIGPSFPNWKFRKSVRISHICFLSTSHSREVLNELNRRCRSGESKVKSITKSPGLKFLKSKASNHMIITITITIIIIIIIIIYYYYKIYIYITWISLGFPYKIPGFSPTSPWNVGSFVPHRSHRAARPRALSADVPPGRRKNSADGPPSPPWRWWFTSGFQWGYCIIHIYIYI